jgi:hypothetical protein
MTNADPLPEARTGVLTPASAPALFKSYGGVKPKPVSEVSGGICLGIYGPGGIGKTTLAGTVCDTDLGWPALYLNARGNPHVIRSRGDKVQIMDVSSFKQAQSIRDDIAKDTKCPYKSIIVDNVTELWSLDLRDRYGANTQIEWTMHSATTADVLALVRNYSDLATSFHKLNVIFIMWETPEKRAIRGEKEKDRSEVAFNKALQSQVPGIITWLGRLYITDEVLYTRCLDFRPIESMQQSKFQVDPDDEATKDIPMEIWNPSLASIIDTVKGGQPWPAAKHQAPSLVDLNRAATAKR